MSQVRLTDESAEIKDEQHTISMNNPLDHRGYTFYQSNYIRVRDPRHGPVHGPVPVGLSGRHQSRPADHLRAVACWWCWEHSSSFTCGREFSPTAARESASELRQSRKQKAAKAVPQAEPALAPQDHVDRSCPA